MSCGGSFGGAGIGACGSMPCGTAAGDGLLPQIVGFVPGLGVPVARLQHIEFDVVDDLGDLRSITVAATFANGQLEPIWDGEQFAAPYVANSAMTRIECGYHFVLRRRGGWTGTPVKLYIVATDPEGLQNMVTA